MTPPTPQNASVLALTLFGPMEVLVEGQPLPPVRSRKILWLLALLTLRQGRPVEREWLAGTLWPDADQTQAFANLRPALSQLRTALGSHASRLAAPNRHTLQFNLSGAEVDVVAFDAAITSRQPGAMERAAAMYRGPLLEGCNEEWVFQERNQREQACLTVLHQLAENALQTGDMVKAVVYLRRTVGIDPLSDSAHQSLMDALARSGDRNAALDLFREFAERLRRDLGAAPHEETVLLYRRLRKEARNNTVQAAAATAETPLTDAAFAASLVVAGHLANTTTVLFGREDERVDVSLLLRRSRLVTLLGPGGMGKTRLAVALASDVVRDYADGVWLVGLESLPASGKVSGKEAILPLVQQMASVLEVKETMGQTLLWSVTEHLRRKKLLLVLDNCEHVLAVCGDLVAHLLQNCPQVRTLATSREALRVTGETVYHLPALAAPPEPDCLPSGSTALLRAVAAYDSVQLFVERARRTGRNTFELTHDNAPAVAQICRQLEGVPLALELAAARVRAMSVGQIAERLNDHLSGPLGLLTGGSRSAQVRQQTLRATLDWSYSLLSQPERVLLHRLSVFSGGWSLEAAEAVGDDRESSGDEKGVQNEPVLDVLTALVDKSLVQFEERDAGDGMGGGRYRFLETVRQYAAERLETSGEAERIKTKHRDWCIDLVQEATGQRLHQALPRLEQEHNNFRAALGWCEADPGGAAAGLQLASALWAFWYVRGYLGEAQKYLRAALERDGAQAKTLSRANALCNVGPLCDDLRGARSCLQEGLAIYRELENQNGVAKALNLLGHNSAALGNAAEARSQYQEGTEIFTALGNKRGVAWSLNNLGFLAQKGADNLSAKAFFEESLRLRREANDKIGVALTLNNLGSVACYQGDLEQARFLVEESLSLRREIGDKEGIADSLHGLGIIASRQGDPSSACAFHREALVTCGGFEKSKVAASSLDRLGGLMVSPLLRRTPVMVAKAVALWAAVSEMRQNMGTVLPAVDQKELDGYQAQARSLLGEAAFAEAWEKGRCLTWEQVVEMALSDDGAQV